MPEPADLYEILQVHPSAHPDLIEAAYRYRSLSETHNPDRNQDADAAARMAAINRAYEVLSDPQQRAAYDRQRARATIGALVPDVISAKSFRLVNDAGQIRAELSLDDDGDPMLVMNDRNGRRRFVIEMAENGNPGLYMYDQTGSDGNIRFAIQQDDDGGQLLSINDRNGDVRLWLGESDAGSPMLFMADQNGKLRLNIIQAGDGSQELLLLDEQENVVVTIDEMSRV